MMISNELSIKEDKTINEIPINKCIVIRLLLQIQSQFHADQAYN